jgi:very-short-patch-repair endonuclease
MGVRMLQRAGGGLWSLVERQDGVVSRGQLLDLGFSKKAIEHGIASGRLHRCRRGVYAVGRPKLTENGRLMAAVLACGPTAALSHGSAAAHWGFLPAWHGPINVSVPLRVARHQPGLVVHRRVVIGPEDVAQFDGIPLTNPICTLIDIASHLHRGRLEAAINEADKRDLAGPDELRAALDKLRRRPGIGVLRRTLDRRAFRLTESGLERRFLSLIDRGGLPMPQTGRTVNGFKVDFYWPDLGIVVETDGLRYHRTPAEQDRDNLRDQTHTAAGLTPLRFSHAQVRYEAQHVIATVTAAIQRSLKPSTP